MIYGKNGSGKTTLLDALTFVLFKKSFREINKPLLVNSINGENCVVEVEFSVGPTECKIIRGIKPETFEIYVNGKLLDQVGVIDDQAYLEKNILKFNLKTFKQIMVLGSKSFVPFMRLPALDRRAVIEELLDIQIFSAMAKVTRNKRDRNQEKLNELDREIQVIQEKIDLQRANILAATSLNQQKIDANNIQILESLITIKNYESQIEQINSTILELQETTSNREILRRDSDKLNRLHTQMYQNLTKNKEGRLFFKSNDTCPVCAQPINPYFKACQIQYHQDKITDLEEGLNQIGTMIHQNEKDLATMLEIDKDIQNRKTEIQVIQNQIQQLKTWISRLENDNNVLANTVYDAEKNDQQLQQFLTEKDIKNYDRVAIQDKKKHLEIAAALLKDSGIKTSIIKQYLPKMNAYINSNLALMDINVNFTLDDNFDEHILARHRDNFAYESFSDGQKMRIDLALLFAWRSVAKLKNSVDTNILIMDEIADSSFDTQGIEDFFQLINAAQNANIFVISPKGEILLDKFDHSIHFQLKNLFSEITDM